MSKFTSRRIGHLALGILILGLLAPHACGQDKPYVTTKTPVRLLSANDGEAVVLLNSQGIFEPSRQPADSVTVIDLGPDQPPQVRTVYGTVPNSIIGPPYMAVSPDGCRGFVTNHGWRFDAPLDDRTDFATLPIERRNLLSMIDLTSPDLKVLDQFTLSSITWMVLAHPDGRQLVVCCDHQFLVFEVVENRLALSRTNESPVTLTGFDINRAGDRIIATGHSQHYTKETPINERDFQVYLFSMEDDRIQFLHRIEIDPQLGKVDAPFAPRFSPDGRRVIVLNGGGMSDKGRLDDILSIDMSLARPAFTEVVRQVADGLESVAFHPRGQMAVVACLGNDITNATPGFARLAVLDLTTTPMRLLYEMPIEPFPEGIEFAADGEQLFVSCTCAHHVAAFDVVGYRLNRSPFILQTGHGPASMAIGPRPGK